MGQHVLWDCQRMAVNPASSFQNGRIRMVLRIGLIWWIYYKVSSKMLKFWARFKKKCVKEMRSMATFLLLMLYMTLLIPEEATTNVCQKFSERVSKGIIFVRDTGEMWYIKKRITGEAVSSQSPTPSTIHPPDMSWHSFIYIMHRHACSVLRY